MTSVRSRSLADRLTRATAPAADLDDLAQRVFATVASEVAFSFACLATTDPSSQLITRAFKSRPLEIGDEEFSAAEYGAPDVNQFADLARRAAPVGALWLDTGGRPETCTRFREFMAPRFGFTDELRLACVSRDVMWCALAVYRSEGEPPFDRSDADLLLGVHEVLADSVRRTLFAREQCREGSGAAVLVLDAGDAVTDLTAPAEANVEDLGGRENGSLPASVIAVAARARATGEPATTRAPTRSGRWLALQALPLDTTRGSVVITLDTAPPAAVGQLRLAARGLTAREQDVVRLVLQGASTKDIAAALFLSPHTVQDHLKAVFRKLEVSSRRELIAQLALDAG